MANDLTSAFVFAFSIDPTIRAFYLQAHHTQARDLVKLMLEAEMFEGHDVIHLGDHNEAELVAERLIELRDLLKLTMITPTIRAFHLQADLDKCTMIVAQPKA